MKILFVTNLFPYSENFEEDTNTKALYNLVKFWNEHVEVIRPLYVPAEIKGQINKSIFPYKRIFINNISVNILPIFKIPKTNIYFYKPLLNYIIKKNMNPDVIISHRLHCAIGASKVAKYYKKPLIIGLHNTDILLLQNYKFKKYYSKIFEQAAAIACRSQSILNEITNIYPQYINKSFIAFSGIEKSIITFPKSNILKIEEWKGRTRPIRFITAARLVKLKNIDVNIKALSMLKSYDWEYYILGEGSEMSYLRKLAFELGVSDRVFFLGKKSRKKVLEHMQFCDIFIMVSSPETFGLAYLEAMAKGCLVIGAYNNGIDGIVEDSVNGFLCEPGLIDELAKKIESIVNSSKAKLLEISNNAYSTILKYTEEAAANGYLEKVREVVNSNQNSQNK